MLKSSARSVIRLRGVRHNNLKNFDLDLPLHQLIVVTGLSGSGKSSLAFDTLFAEGQRRYIETFSPYARQFFDRMDKPQVDSIEGIPPAIAIEQRNTVKTTRSTVGTMTEICDYMKVLWPHVAQLHCRQCGHPVRQDAPRQIWKILRNPDNGGRKSEFLVTFDVPLSDKLSLEESLALVSKQGYQRLLIGGQILRLDDLLPRTPPLAPRTSHLTVVQDRLKLTPSSRPRFVEACEQAYHFGKGKLAVHETQEDTPKSKLKIQKSKLFSNRLHCAHCDIEYREPSPPLFSFNHPVGACPACRGFGRVISIDYNLALPDRSRTLAEGVVKPWQTGHGLESQRDLLRTCRHFEIPTNVPFERLPKKWQNFVIEGEPDYGNDEEHEWPRAWYGVKGYFRWLESKAYKMHVRVLLSRYRAYTTCPDCQGARFQPETLLYKFTMDGLRLTRCDTDDPSAPETDASIVTRKSQITLADFYGLPIRDALAWIEVLATSRVTSILGSTSRTANDPVGLVLTEVRSRLGYLKEAGLGYLTLDRPTRSLSGGETERVNLTTCLGTRLVNTLFVLDEPSVGLHPRDTERLVRILEQLRNAGNTVVVVEHEPSVMRAADQIVDLGPGHGATGGEVVFQGPYQEILKSNESLTGQYLSGRQQVPIPHRRLASSEPGQRSRRGGTELQTGWLRIKNATLHNLRNLSVEIPLGRFVCVTGVSGSGKTTLVREVLFPTLEANLKSHISNLKPAAKASERIEDPPSQRFGKPIEDADENDSSSVVTRHTSRLEGWEGLGRVLLVDQSILGKTPRSNPAVYIGAFDDIRELFAQSEQARQRGLNASAFSFNSGQGQCERCRGAGFEKIEMQFLSDVFIRCPDCGGRRYRQHILEVKVSSAKCQGSGKAGVSDLTPDPSHLTPGTPHLAPIAWSIADMLEATVDEAIEFLGAFPESRQAQRALESLRLLLEVGLGYLRLGQPINTLSGGESQRLKLVRHLAEVGVDPRPTLFLFDEPTTGLHFDDVRVLLKVFQRLVDSGHSIVVVEHNLEVVKCADWIIDLGPDAGDEGGRIIAQGTPEAIAECEASHTGQFLRELLVARADPAPARESGAPRSRGQRATATTRLEASR